MNMVKLSDRITDFYISKNYVPENKREIYSYGFNIIIADIINFSLIIILGIISKQVLQSVIFLIVLCVVRRYSGGFHAKAYWRCRLCMIVTFLGTMAVTYIVFNYVGANIFFCGIVNIISLLFISVLAPVKHPNKTLNERQVKNNKIKAIITSLIFSVISVIGILENRIEGVTISMTLAAVVILMIIGIAVQKKGGEKDV